MKKEGRHKHKSFTRPSKNISTQKRVSLNTTPIPFYGNFDLNVLDGGTSFDVIEEFATQLHQYPDLIVVLTDGFASPPTVRHPQRWFWLITEDGTPIHIEGIGRYCLIENMSFNSLELVQLG